MGKGIPHGLQLPFARQPGFLLLPPPGAHTDKSGTNLAGRPPHKRGLPLWHTNGNDLRKARKQSGELLVLLVRTLRLPEVTCTGSHCHWVVGLGLEPMPPQSQYSLYSASLYEQNPGPGLRMASAPRPRTGALNKSHDIHGAQESQRSWELVLHMHCRQPRLSRGQGCVSRASPGPTLPSDWLSISLAHTSNHSGDQGGGGGGAGELHLNSQKTHDHSYHHIQNERVLLETGDCNFEVTDLSELPSSTPCLFPKASSAPIPSPCAHLAREGMWAIMGGRGFLNSQSNHPRGAAFSKDLLGSYRTS